MKLFCSWQAGVTFFVFSCADAMILLSMNSRQALVSQCRHTSQIQFIKLQYYPVLCTNGAHDEMKLFVALESPRIGNSADGYVEHSV